MPVRIQRFPAAFAAASLLIGGATRVARAQAHIVRGTIDGVVTDTSFRPLGNATISVVGSTLRVVTGTNGRFRMTDIAPGQYDLLALRLGYKPASALLQVSASDTLRVSLALQRVPTVLDTVSIKAKQLTWGLTEFEQRKKLGEGQFMTQTEIEKKNVVVVSDLIRTFRGVKGDGTNARNFAGHPCPFEYFVDGVKAKGRGDIDNAVLPGELAGIELYLGPATIPLQYESSTGGGFCGVILLWRKIGS